MKINKLLLFLLALASLNSCVEYVDNGVIPPGPEKPEERLYAAEVANPEEAKYVGDKFEFKATLNGVDVTKSSKFKVNGVATTNNASFYIPHKTGSHSVIATMDDYEATFKFTVLEKDEEEPEPEPTGNRIEYGGKSYPVSETVWIVHSDGGIKAYNNSNGVACTVWLMISSEYDSNDKVLHQFATAVYVPIKSDQTLAFPNESSGAFEHINGGAVVINGSKVFDTTNATYTFAGTGNTAPTGTPAPWSGTANYTSIATGASSGNSAELFWDGTWSGREAKLLSKAKMGNIINGFDASQINN